MRIIFKIQLLILFSTSLAIGQSLNIFEADDLEKIKTKYFKYGHFQKEIDALNYLAREAIAESPYSITKYLAPFIEGCTVNDYYSDSPYWWPVEGDSKAPYIRRDGERNPDRFMEHKQEGSKFYKGLLALSFFSYFTDDSSLVWKANELLKIWFLDNETKMNPSLKYSQLIRNRTKPRGVGIIEGRRLALLTEAIILLKNNGLLEDDIYFGIKKWYSEYLKWLTTSFYGLDEKQRGNNHGTWWAAQIATISNFLQIEDSIKAINTHSRLYLLDNQVDTNSRQPLEEERTRSLAYSIFNVTAHSYLNAILLKYGINNWNYINKNGVTLINVIDYLVPYVKNPSSWNIPQLKMFDNSSPLFLGYAGLQLKNIEYLKIYNELSFYEIKDLKNPSFDPMQILLDAVVKLNLTEE